MASANKFQAFAQSPANYLSHPVMPSLVFILYQFVVFTYDWNYLMCTFYSSVYYQSFHSLRVLHTSVNWWFFTEVCDSNSPEVSRTLLYVLSNLSNFVIYEVLILLLISISATVLETVPTVPTTIRVTDTFIFHSLFSSLARSKYLLIFSLCFIFSFLLVFFFFFFFFFFFLVGVLSTRFALLAGIE